jgi:hypothetical protein
LILTIVLQVASLGFLLRHQPRGGGPMMLAVFGTPLVLMNPVVNLMQDHGTVKGDNLALNRMLNTITWLGVIQVTAASLWNSNVDIRLHEWWQRRRGASAST